MTSAWMAFVSIIAIIGIVVVGGGLIAFLGRMILGVFGSKMDTASSSKSNEATVVTYNQYNTKALENTKEKEDEYDFVDLEKAKAEQKKAIGEDKDLSEDDDIFNLTEEEDADLADLEKRLAAEGGDEKPVVAKEEPKKAAAPVQEEEDDFDLDALLNEISTDVVDDEAERIQEESKPKMDDSLNNYNIDDILRSLNEESEEEPETEEPVTPDVEEEDETEEEPVIAQQPMVVKEDNSADKKEIESLKAQLEDLNRQLEEARTAKTEVVSIDMTEESCLERLQVLEERLKGLKREYKINMKEYRPLKKVMDNLTKYQTRLRRKENTVVKLKMDLYGVNNYSDLDKEKAERLSNELELYDGLRLSVSHCEEVINANKDRYPILEHTNKILEDQIASVEADIAGVNETLKKIRGEDGDDEKTGE